jgi:hypothetical protein
MFYKIRTLDPFGFDPEKRTDRLVPLNSFEGDFAKMALVADLLERTQKKPTKLVKKEKRAEAGTNIELGLRFPMPDGLVTRSLIHVT